MKFGLVGCGNIAYWMHLRALRSIRGVTLAAAADPDPAARERARRLSGVHVYERPDELFGREDIDAVVICTPTHLHAQHAIAAAVAGKHFYLEKPIATTAADARRVMEAAAQAGVTGVMGFNRRLHPLYEQARHLLASGRIGRVRAVQTACCESMPLETMPQWRRRRETGGGVLLELASHHIDQLRWLLGDEVACARASLRSELTEQDTARVELSMAGGVEVQGFFSFRAGLTDYMEFLGDGGALRVDRHSPRLSLRVGRRFGYGVRRPWIAPTPSAGAWRLQRLFRPSIDPSFRRALRAFLDLVRGRENRVASLQDGLRSLEVILAAEDSAGRVVPGNPDGAETGTPCAYC